MRGQTKSVTACLKIDFNVFSTIFTLGGARRRERFVAGKEVAGNVYFRAIGTSFR